MRAFYVPAMGPAQFIDIQLDHHHVGGETALPAHVDRFPNEISYRMFTMPSGVKVIVCYSTERKDLPVSFDILNHHGLRWRGNILVYRLTREGKGFQSMDPTKDLWMAWDAIR